MDQERKGAVAADDIDDTAADATEGDEPIEVAGGVAAAGRRLISEDWAATIVGLVLLALVLAGVIGKGMVP